jgi:hypothetical protein
MKLTNPLRSFPGDQSGISIACFSLVVALAAVNGVGTIAPLAVVHAAGNLVDGWSVRADSGTGADNKLTLEGAGAFQFVTGGPPSNNGTYFNPAWTANRQPYFFCHLYPDVKATHPDAYGLMFGGANPTDDNQTYTYFEVQPDIR